MNNLRKAKSLLINPRFQWSVIAWFSSVALAVIGVFFLAMLWFFHNLKAQGIAAGLSADHPLFRYIHAQELEFFRVFAFSSVVTLLILLAGGLYLSHRVAGPLYRLTMHLRAASRSSVKPVKFRHGDYFPELETAFNEFVERED